MRDFADQEDEDFILEKFDDDRDINDFDTIMTASESTSTWGWTEFASTMAQHFLYSKYNYFLWIFQVLLNIFALLWTVSHHLRRTKGHDEDWFIILEVALNFVMMFEISVRICATGRGFWDYWWNLADVMVMVLCVLATLYYLLMHDTRRGGLEAEEAIIADEVLITLRSSMHVFRLVLFLKNKRSMDSATHSTVEFSALAADDMDDDRLMSTTAQSQPEDMHIAQDHEDADRGGESDPEVL